MRLGNRTYRVWVNENYPFNKLIFIKIYPKQKIHKPNKLSPVSPYLSAQRTLTLQKKHSYNADLLISDKRTIFTDGHNLNKRIVQVELERLTDRRIVLIAGAPLPNITNRQETAIFDWEDFEIAGGLDKLLEIIAIRERFEQERENLTADSSREEVQRVLECSQRQANRVLQRLRGGNIPRKTFKEQILSLLTDGEKKTAEITAAIDGHPEAIQHELTRLVEADEIVRIRRGVYALPKQ